MKKMLFCKLCAEKTEHEILYRCICEDKQDSEYTYQDEFGECEYCLGKPARCCECNSSRELVEMIDNFELPYQVFISEFERYNYCTFVGCLESDNVLVFRSREGLKIVLKRQ